MAVIVPLLARDMSFDRIREWVSGLSVGGSARWEGKALGASRVIQAYQVVSQVLRFAVRAKYLAANPADGIELPRKRDVDQRYLTHRQLHRSHWTATGTCSPMTSPGSRTPSTLLPKMLRAGCGLSPHSG